MTLGRSKDDPMTENKLATLVYVLIALVCLNIGISTYLILRPGTNSGGQPKESVKKFSDEKINSIARQTVALYNQKKSSELYATFDGIARVQFSEKTLSDQMARLHSMVGTIGDFAYSHTQFLGTQETKEFYNVLYKVRLQGGTFRTGELKLTVYEKGDGLALVGFFLNGQDDGRVER
jgi:hypothetical protein